MGLGIRYPNVKKRLPWMFRPLRKQRPSQKHQFPHPPLLPHRLPLIDAEAPEGLGADEGGCGVHY